MSGDLKLTRVVRNTKGDKEFTAYFLKDGKEKITRFGTSSNFLLNSSKTEADRKAYISRHKVNENWNDPTSAGALSRYLLCETRSLTKNIRRFRKRYGV